MNPEIKSPSPSVDDFTHTLYFTAKMALHFIVFHFVANSAENHVSMSSFE